MIREKQLAAAMKRAYTGGGYEVIGFAEGCTDKFYIAKTAGWAVLVPRKLAGRKVLALLAEHLGEIPDGTAWSVSKVRDAQMMAPELLQEGIDKLRRLCTGKAGTVWEEIQKTHLTYGGRQIWQTDSGQVALVPGYSAMAPEEAVGYYVGDAVIWDDGNCLLMVKEDSMILPEDLEEALKSIQLPK